MQSKFIRTRTALATAIFFAIAFNASAGKSPFEEGQITRGTTQDGIELISTPALKVADLILRHVGNHTPGTAQRFAEGFPSNLTLKDVGTWREVGNDATWQLLIESPNALSINLGFKEFHLPEGASLTLSRGDGSEKIRPLTHEDNQPFGGYWTPMVMGESMLLSLSVPKAKRNEVKLQLESINAGFIDPTLPLTETRSGSCNVDVVCPQGDNWRDEIRSVGAYTRGGVDYCSGALINNVRNDLKPYFLTANHCASTAAHANSIVVYWNYQNSTCRTPGSAASGGAGDGQRNQFNSGTTLRATRSASDFTLLELNQPVNPDFNPFWSGFDASGTTPTNAVGIHHPRVEEKRISFEDQALTITSYLQTGGGTTHWRVADWDVGTTEGGSSGSPLYSGYPDKKIIGQLHGGEAACGNDDGDWYGRLSVSWDAGGTAATQLKDWLDPDNTGTRIIGGTNASPFSLSVAPNPINACTEGLAGISSSISITATNPSFTGPVTLSATSTPALTLVYPTTPLSVGSNVGLLTVNSLAALGTVSGQITLTGTSGTDTASTTIPFNFAASLPAAAQLTSPAHQSVGNSITPTLSWTGTAASNLVEVATDPAFTNIVQTHTVTSNSVALTSLSTNTTYYWRVTASNSCGNASASPVFRFKTAPAPGDCDDSQTTELLFSEDFSAGFNGFTTTGSTGASTWVINSAQPSPVSGGNAAFAQSVNAVSDQRLISPSIALPSDASSISLKYQNRRRIEGGSSGCFDGGILEISSNGGEFIQLESEILNDPYTNTVSGSYSNPLAGKRAWCENTLRDYANTIVDLSDYVGQNVQLRWRFASDTSVTAEGWRVDDIQVNACKTSDTPLPDAIFADGFETQK